MSERLKAGAQMFGAWCGIGYLVLVFGGWGLCAGFLPPTAPTDTAADIAALYESDYTRIRIGMLLVMLAALVLIPFSAAVARALSRIEGGPGILTYSFLLGAAGTMVLTFYPAIWWLTAAFRPERGAELIYVFNDLAWLQLIGGITIYLAMPFSVAVAAFADSSDDPVFPRWAGYACAMLGLMVIPDQLLFFFKTGPFAWNGLFGLWVPAAAFGGFFIITVIVMRQALLRSRSREYPGVAASQPMTPARS